MAKCFNSAFGELSGKVGNFVFFRYRGMQFVRIYSSCYKNVPHLIEKSVNGGIAFSEIKRLNHHVLFGLLNWLYKRKLKSLVDDCWARLCERKRLRMTSRNLFVSQNFTYIFKSIPLITKPIGLDNGPDFSELLITEGDLWAPREIKSISYRPTTGHFSILWDSSIFGDAKPEDEANIVILYWKPNILSLKPWATIKVWDGKAKRKDGYFSLNIDNRLKPNFLTAFLFFKNSTGCSDSISIKL